MKKSLAICLLWTSTSLLAQRPATEAEHAEDARVLKILSAAMPHNLENAEESERSDGVSNLEGLTGFHSDRNFATRDAFDHQYNIRYEYTRKAAKELQSKVDAARNRNDFEYLVGVSSCDIYVYVNSNTSEGSLPYASSPLKKISTSYGQQVYRDEKGKDMTVLFFGNNWTITPSSFAAEDGNGKPEKRYTLKTKLPLHPGAAIQGIFIAVRAHADLADIILRQVNWRQISNLLGTGQLQENTSESELKKYFPEKPVKNVAGLNTLSFTYVDSKGVEKQFAISSSKHDFSNGACLRNHNENPAILQEAHIDFHLADDKNPNRLFMLSLPIIRTTGVVTATYQSDYDYQVMWRGNPDPDHSFTAVSIEIHLDKWAPVGDFIEGTFSGKATLNDHNDFSTEKPAFEIKNGKFRIRRIADQIR